MKLFTRLNVQRHVCSNSSLILFSFATYHRVCNKSNTMGVTSGTGTANRFGTPEFTLVFSVVCVTQSLVSCVV